MNKNLLSDAIGQIDDSLVEETLQRRAVRPRYVKRWIATAACICVLAGCLLALPLLGGGPAPVPPGDGATDGETAASVSTTTSQFVAGTTLAQNGVGNGDDKGTTVKTTNKGTVTSAGLPGSSDGLSPFAVAQPMYPTTLRRPGTDVVDGPTFDAWWDSLGAQEREAAKYTGGMTDFYARTMKSFLAGEPGENRVYSPLNVYLALSMLAETAGGNTRSQILSLLGVTDLPALRKKCAGLWEGAYMDDGAVTSRLANSLWLAEGSRWSYAPDTVNRLAKDYYASVFRGKMGSAAYNTALHNWLNAQTDDLLKEQAANLAFDPDTALALASTICFRAKWQNEFDPNTTKKGVFHTATGDVTLDYMGKETFMEPAYFGENFAAIRLDLDVSEYQMYFVLPDEGVSVEQLPGDRQVLSMLQRNMEEKYAKIIMEIPKFDVVSDRDLCDGLKQLGITDAFDLKKGDFTGIFSPQKEPVYVSQIQHAARVAIDEEGVIAAAYTVEMIAGAGAPEETLHFVLDRPFMFAITGPGDAILFTGIVEKP